MLVPRFPSQSADQRNRSGARPSGFSPCAKAAYPPDTWPILFARYLYPGIPRNLRGLIRFCRGRSMGWLAAERGDAPSPAVLELHRPMLRFGARGAPATLKLTPSARAANSTAPAGSGVNPGPCSAPPHLGQLAVKAPHGMICSDRARPCRIDWLDDRILRTRQRESDSLALADHTRYAGSKRAGPAVQASRSAGDDRQPSATRLTQPWHGKLATRCSL